MPLNLSLQEKLVKIRREAEEREAQRISQKTGVEYFDARNIPVDVEALQVIPEEKARELKLAAFEKKQKELFVLALNPENAQVARYIKDLQGEGYTIRLFAGSSHALEHVWSFYKFAAKQKASITSRVNIGKEKVLSLITELRGIPQVTKRVEAFDFEKGQVVDFLEFVLSGALANRASDIHFEPTEKQVRLRYRVDGDLHDLSTALPQSFYKSITSRIKLLSKLKINVSDRPQDGRFTIGLGVKDVEVRVAIAPSEFGEIIVLRVLDPDAINITLQDLGLRKDDLEILQTELKRPNGIILNTGPTGAGKTTTLYACLKMRQDSEIKIITIEDPIEYHLSGIEQTQVDESAGYGFQDGLKSIMRQDPDVILVGEIRDKITAETAIQSALTGHLVLSTVHANTAPGAIPRLLDLGVRSTSIGPAINLIIGQRLVRTLCDACKEEVQIPEAVQSDIQAFLKKLPARVSKDELSINRHWRAKGCDACANEGYIGRIAVFELFLNDPSYEAISRGDDEAHAKLASEGELEDLIKKGANESEMFSYAQKKGMVTMQEDGILKVLAGRTTFSEIEEKTGTLPAFLKSLL